MDKRRSWVHDGITYLKDTCGLFLMVGLAAALEWAGIQPLSYYAVWWEHFVIAPLWHWSKESFRYMLIIFAVLETLRGLLMDAPSSGKKAGLFFSTLLGCAILISLLNAPFIVQDPALERWAEAVAVDLILTIGALALLNSPTPLVQEIVNAASDLIDELKQALFQARLEERRR